MSLCIAHGHSEAFHYPLGLVMDEAHFARERENTRMTTEAELIRQAVAGILNSGSRKQFSKLVKELNVETKPLISRFGDDPSPLTPEQKEGPKVKRSLANAVLPKGVNPEAPEG